MDKEKEILKLDMDCINCGQPAVAGSNLCADCLVKERDILEKEVLIKMAIIKAQKMRIIHLGTLLKDALGHGFKKNQENIRLLKYTKILERERREVMEDGKNR